ncbi:MAG: glycine cleavage system protein GcvH [bacterium]|nr:glycine cleavage system protein GcvH [bacterium]
MNVPDGLLFTKEHEWVRLAGATAVMGISDHAQTALGDITYVDLPGVGKTVAQGGGVAVVESVKAASDVYAPVSGTVRAVNAALGDHPEIINQDPYGKGWLCELENVAPDAAGGLMTAAQYRSYLETL